jgi:ribose/xylose/arabinose/galactoside ABC-type transport system permease subunit
MKNNVTRIILVLLVAIAIGALLGFISGTYNMPMIATIGMPIFFAVAGFLYIRSRQTQK